MSKRLIRIAASKLHPELKKLISVELSAVLNNGRTYLGKLVSFDHKSIVLTDSRDHSHVLAVRELYEIVYDTTKQIRIK